MSFEDGSIWSLYGPVTAVLLVSGHTKDDVILMFLFTLPVIGKINFIFLFLGEFYYFCPRCENADQGAIGAE